MGTYGLTYSLYHPEGFNYRMRMHFFSNLLMKEIAIAYFQMFPISLMHPPN